MQWEKKGCIYKASHEAAWWRSHTMAPAAFMLNADTIRVLLGCWDEQGIARIGYLDLAAYDPRTCLGKSSIPLLDLGGAGCFDERGVFPAHVTRLQERVYLYYTGFQRVGPEQFTNFGGLALSDDGGVTFTRISTEPVMGRADEGTFTRSGISVLFQNNVFRAVYSAGNGWVEVAGKQRPTYEVFYQESEDGLCFADRGKRIVAYERRTEHGLGRPQLVAIDGVDYVFYTRRTLDYRRYGMGIARSKGPSSWERVDALLSGITHGPEGAFDSHMVYFPCFLDTGRRRFLFYSGNGYGKEGLGYAEWVS